MSLKQHNNETVKMVWSFKASFISQKVLGFILADEDSESEDLFEIEEEECETNSASGSESKVKISVSA